MKNIFESNLFFPYSSQSKANSGSDHHNRREKGINFYALSPHKEESRFFGEILL